MRLCSFALVASTAILARNTNSAEAAVLKMAKVSLLGSVRSSISNHDGSHVERLLTGHEGSPGEERMRLPLTSRTVQTIKNEVLKIYRKLFDHVDKLDYHEDFKRAVMSSERKIYSRFLWALKIRDPKSVEKLRVDLLSSEEQGTIPEEKLIAHIRAFENLLQKKELEKMKVKRAKWIQDGVLPLDVVTRLIVRDDRLNNPFTSLHLKTLKTYIKDYNKKVGTSHTLLETLSKGFGGEAKFAPILSVVSHGHIHGLQAQRMQMDLLWSWLYEDKSIDVVAEILRIRSQGKRALAFHNLDTLDKYIKLFGNVHPEEKTDLFTFLRKKFGDRKFAMLIEEAEAVDELAFTFEEDLFQHWKTEGLMPEDVDSKFFFARATRRISAAAANTEKRICAKFTRWFAENQ